MDDEKNITNEDELIINDSVESASTNEPDDITNEATEVDTSSVNSSVNSSDTDNQNNFQQVPPQATNPNPNPAAQPDQYARYAAPNGYWNGNQPYGFIGYAPMGYPNGMMMPPVPPKKPSKAKKVFGAIGLATIFGLVAALVFIITVGLYKKYIYTPDDNKTTTTQLHISDKSSEDTKLNLEPVADANKQISSTIVSENASTASTDVSKVVEAAMPAIVSIDCTFQKNSVWGTYETPGAGSGIVLQKTDTELLVATNSHVINDALTIKVTFNNGKAFDAAVKGKDKYADLAVIAIPLKNIDSETLNAISVAKLGSSDDIKVGQMAIAIGNSLGYGQSVTVGYISAKDREVKVDNKTMILLQTDAAINPGNSGGALLNIEGEVIGINSVKYADSTVDGMGFAIPISRAFDILTELSSREILADDEKGYLGVYIENVPANNTYNWPVGVYVSSLVKDGAAEKAGVFAGDIITAVNGATVTTADELTERIQSFRYGTEVKLTVQRMNEGVFEEKEITITLIQNPSISGLEAEDSSEKNNSDDKTPETVVPDGNGDSNKLPDSNNGRVPNENNGDGYYYYDPFGFDGFDPFDPFSFFNY